MTYLLLFAVSLVITLVLTPVMREFFRDRGWVDYPDRKRKLHGTPIPRLGGIPISIAFFSSVALLYILPRATLAVQFRAHDQNLFKVFLPSLLILAVGVWDDIKGASPWLKIAVQCGAAIWLWTQGICVSKIGVPGTNGIHLGYATLPITILWIVGISNALNLVDGLDGLASGVAFFAAITMFVVALTQQNIELSIMAIALSGATLAFLRFNFNPATVFLGDSGSLFLGYLLGAFSLLWSSKASTLVAVVAPLFTLGLPIAEVGISVFRRFIRGQPVFGADREHIHHRLLLRGLTPRSAVAVLYGVCAILGICSLILANWQTRTTGLILLVLVAAGWMGIQQLGYHEFGEAGDSIRRGLFQQRRVINTHVRLRNLGGELARISAWTDLIEVLRDVGSELGFHKVVINLSGRAGALPVGVSPRMMLACVPEELFPDESRCWRVDIPIGSQIGDDSRIVFSRGIESGSTVYMVSVLVEVLSESLPPAVDRILNQMSAPPPKTSTLPGTTATQAQHA